LRPQKFFNYKKIIKNRKARLKIIKLFNWLPDKQMIKLQYWIKTGRKLNLKNPKRFTEKLQWYKLYYRDPLMAFCSDKFLVRQYVKSKGLEHILNEIYGVYDDVNQIDFDRLPNQFVLKKTTGGGGNEIIICKDKSKFDIEKAKEIMKDWTKKESNGGGREWVYFQWKPRIIVEKYINFDNEEGLVDYKFFCFEGKAHYLYVINGRKLGVKTNLGIFDLNYKMLPYFRTDEDKMINIPPKPKNSDRMIKIAEFYLKIFLMLE